MFLITETSTSENPGPVNRLRARLPAGSVVPGQGSVGVMNDPGIQNAAGFTHCWPPRAAEKPGVTPTKGFAIKFNPGRCVPALKLKGCPLWKFTPPPICQPCVSIAGPCEEPGML